MPVTEYNSRQDQTTRQGLVHHEPKALTVTSGHKSRRTRASRNKAAYKQTGNGLDMAAAQTMKAPRKKRKPAEKVKIRKPQPGSKAEAILTLAATTPARPVEIAESVNATRAHVTQTLKRYGIEPNRLESFKQHRADILAGIQEKILDSVNMAGIKVESAKELRDALTGFGILTDKERLERGQSTQNIASMSLILEAACQPKAVDNSKKEVDNSDNNSHNSTESEIIDI